MNLLWNKIWNYISATQHTVKFYRKQINKQFPAPINLLITSGKIKIFNYDLMFYLLCERKFCKNLKTVFIFKYWIDWKKCFLYNPVKVLFLRNIMKAFSIVQHFTMSYQGVQLLYFHLDISYIKRVLFKSVRAECKQISYM